MKKNSLPNNPHPSRESLAGFAHEPNSPRYAEVAEHAEHCASCTTAIERVKKMVAVIKARGSVTPLLPSHNHLTAADLVRYLSEPDLVEHTAWRKHLDSCQDCRRALMLQRARQHDASRSSPTVTHPPKLVWWKKSVPVWTTLPLSLAASVVFTLTLAPLFIPSAEAPRVTAYQDDARLFLLSADAPSGLGFFPQTEKHAVPFAGITVSVENESLRLQWPEIENALDYEIQIQVHETATPRTFIQTRVTSPELHIDRNQLTPGKRYTWELSGIQRDGTRFLTRGGFLYTQENKM